MVYVVLFFVGFALLWWGWFSVDLLLLMMYFIEVGFSNCDSFVCVCCLVFTILAGGLFVLDRFVGC